MKKKKHLSFICLWLFGMCPMLIFSQKTISKVIYKKKSTIILNNKRKNNQAVVLLKTAFEEMDNLEYRLVFTKEKALFEEVSDMDVTDEYSIALRLAKSMGDTFYKCKK